MKTIHLRSRSGPDGTLTLKVPTDSANAELDVLVTVSPAAAPGIPQTDADWLRFVKSTAGSIQDPDFVRPPQGEFETRDELA